MAEDRDAEHRDILELLIEDHREFRSLFSEISSAAPEDREDILRYLVSRLASHEAAEEAVVHPTLRDDVPGGREIAEDVLAEEDRAERLLADLDDVDPTATEFGAAMAQLSKEVLGHAEHEERDEFPKLREHIDVDRRKDMGRTFQKLRDSGPTRPHPHTPQTPEVRALAGPIVGILDRARDAARDAFSR